MRVTTHNIKVQVVNSRMSYYQILNPFGSPYETGNLGQVAGATIQDVLLFATVEPSIIDVDSFFMCLKSTQIAFSGCPIPFPQSRRQLWMVPIGYLQLVSLCRKKLTILKTQKFISYRPYDMY